MDFDESINLLEEMNTPKILVDDGCWKAAFPSKVEKFMGEKVCYLQLLAHVDSFISH